MVRSRMGIRKMITIRREEGGLNLLRQKNAVPRISNLVLVLGVVVVEIGPEGRMMEGGAAMNGIITIGMISNRRIGIGKTTEEITALKLQAGTKITEGIIVPIQADVINRRVEILSLVRLRIIMQVVGEEADEVVGFLLQAVVEDQDRRAMVGEDEVGEEGGIGVSC